ncbi:unnamed protein product [Hymenolepis diminuta]|nr:unnamed protein product [Hymenolepis diminuta]
MDSDKTKRLVGFVSGHTGGTSVELMGLVLIACYVGYIKMESERLFFRNLSHSKVLLIDFFLIIVTTVLPCTLLSNYILEYHFVLLAVVVIFKLKAPKDPSSIHILDGYVAFRRLIRAFVLLYSCVCICGVDLTIFPQRFAKTETSGISLMDLGVGMIVVAIGLSNASFLDVAQTKSQRKVVETLIRATIPCLVIGGIQTLTTNVLGYPDHEAEYGIHWNFFFTLAFIRLGGFLATYTFSRMSDFDSMTIHFALCVALASIQQFLVLPMVDHVFPHLTHPKISRPSSKRYFDFWWLIQANAEGIVTLPGYLSLYFYATALGITLRLHLEPPKENGQSEQKLKFLCRQGKEEWFGNPKKIAVAVFSISIPMFLIVAAYGESSVSRRLVNLPYIALQIGLSAPPFAFFIYRSFTTPVSKRGRRDLIPFFAKIADHGILYVLVAKLITGGLNFLFDSLAFLDMRPAWFSNLCQFVLLSIYAGICPLLTERFSKAIFRKRRWAATKKTE